MKFYHALIVVAVGISIVLVQPQLTIAHNLAPALDKPYTETSIAVTAKAEDFLIQGKLKYQQEDYEGAIAAFTQAIRLNPDDATAYNYRGNIRNLLKDHQGAIEDYTQALQIDPNNADVYFSRGLARSLSEDYQGAIEDYTQTLQIDPNNADVYFVRGLARSLLKDYQGAMEDYTQALQIDPNHADGYFARGHTRSLLKDYQGAMEDYTQALQIDPNNADISNRLNLLKAKDATWLFSAILCLVWLISISLHEFGHAIVAYWGGDRSVKAKGYLTLNPLNYANPLVSILLPSFFFLLGAFPLPGAAVYIERQQLRNRGWQSAVSAAGPFASLLVTLFLVALFQVSSVWNLPYGFSTALAFFINLHFLFILFNLIPIPPLDGYGMIEPWLPEQFQARLRQFAFLWLLLIVALPWLVPSFALFLSNSASVLSDRLGVPEALAWDGFDLFNRWYCALLLGVVGVLALIRQPHSIWHFLGDILFSFQAYNLAITAYDKAIDWAPRVRPWTHGQAWIGRGFVLAQLGRNEEAIQAFEQSIQFNPNNYRAWSARGYTLSLLKQYKEAIAAYDKALELKPGNDWFYWHGRGFVLKSLERYEEALSAYNKAVKLAPKNFVVWLNYGLVLEKLARYQEALVAYDQAIKLNPALRNSVVVRWKYHNQLLGKLGRSDNG
jgi:tetratricopeptide (TPR) repeat protein